MGVTVAQLAAEVKVMGVQQAKADLQGMGQAVKETQGGIKGMLGNALSFAAGQAVFAAVGAAAGFLKDQISSVFDVTMAHDAVMAQLNSRLKDTRDAVGLSSSAIASYAASLSRVTPFSQDAILQGDNMLLTFTSIGKKVFPDASHAMVELAQVMGGDMQGAAIQLGKAMDDPIQGINALKRDGVSFTQAQKDLIKHMMDVGNVAGAQKVILQALAGQGFGSAAEAAGKTLGGQLQILKNSFDDIKIKIGDAFLPILQKVTGWIQSNVVPAFDAFSDWFTKTGLPAIEQFGGYLQGIVAPIFQNVAGFVQSNVLPIFGQLGKLFGGLGKDSGIGGFVQSLKGGFDQVKGIVGGELGKDFQLLGNTVKDLGGWFKTSMLPAIKDAMPGFEKLGSVIATDVAPAMAKIWAVAQQLGRDAIPPLVNAFKTIEPVVVRVAGFLAGQLGNGLKAIMPDIMNAAQAVGKFANDLSTRAQPIIENISKVIKTFLDWIGPYWPTIWGQISAGFIATWDIIKGVFQIIWSVFTGSWKIMLDIVQGHWQQAWTDIKDMFSGIWEGIKNIAAGVFEPVKRPIMAGIDAFKTSWQKGWDTVSTTFNNVWNGMKDFVGGVWSGITGAVKSGINDVIGLINNFISGLDNLHVNLPGGGSVGFSIPLIPYLAEGGLIAKGGLAVVGERGPERVWLPQGAQVVPNSQSFGSGSSANQQPIVVVVEMDGQLLTRGIMPHFANEVRYRTGIFGI